MKQPLIVLTGPTAVGKTALSIRLAKAVGGEIISADSMQVYRHMDIGSAKVTPGEMDGVPHYLIDVLDPRDSFNVVTFQQMAKEALREIYSHGRIPVIAGGTGFYIQALLYDIDFKENEDDSPVRRELEALAEREGERAPRLLHSMLRQVDPEAAVQIHANNIKRVIRAIEYFRQTGEKISLHNQQEREKKSPYNFLYYVLNTDRALLYERIDRRVDLMVEQGLVAKYVVDGTSSACFEYLGHDEHCHKHICFHCKCEKCGKVIHLECGEMAHLGEHMLADHGFQWDFTRTVFYGICEECRGK